jgi:mxaD protein
MHTRTTALILFCCVSTALAHGPTPQKVDESVEVAAPPQRVWQLLGDFATMAAWNPAIKESSADKGNQNGSLRRLKLAQGGEISEQLDDYDGEKLSMTYRSGADLDPAVFPVSSYSARLSVKAAGDGSRVEWRARAYRADTGNEPPEGRDDASAVNALRAYIQPGLAAVKQKLEASR